MDIAGVIARIDRIEDAIDMLADAVLVQNQGDLPQTSRTVQLAVEAKKMIGRE